MARVKVELPTELIKQFESLNMNTEKMLGEMTTAGAKVALENMKANAPLPQMASHAKLSKVYKTPSDDGINTKAYFSGYLPFSTPNRKTFSRRGATGGTVYTTDKGVPVDFLAKVFEYGRSNRPFPKKPFVRKSFNKTGITQAMMKAQENAINKYWGTE